MLKLFSFGVFAATALYITRCYIVGKKCRCKRQYSANDIIIITGASSGIGLATAVEVAKRGAKVILACRDIQKGKIAKTKIIKESSNIHITVLELDLASFRSIREFVAKVKHQVAGQPITALVNNAGVFYFPPSLTEDGYDVTFQTNYLGPFLLTILLLPSLHRAPGAKIVNLSSATHSQLSEINIPALGDFHENKYDRFEAYQISKLCLVLFTTKLSQILEDTFTKVLAVDPGNVETAIYRNFPPLANPFFFALQKPIRLFVIKTPLEGCQGVLHALLCPDAGLYIKNAKTSSEVSTFIHRPKVVEDLWKYTRKWVNIKD